MLGWLRVHTLLGPEFWDQNSFRRVSSVTQFIHSTGSGWGSRSAGRAQSIHSSLRDGFDSYQLGHLWVEIYTIFLEKVQVMQVGKVYRHSSIVVIGVVFTTGEPKCSG